MIRRRHRARWGRIASAAWGAFGVLTAMAFARTGTGVLELVNLIGSAFYGPILAVFVLGMLDPGRDRAPVRSRDWRRDCCSIFSSRGWCRSCHGSGGIRRDSSRRRLIALLTSRRPVEWIRPEWRPREGAVLVATFGVILGVCWSSRPAWWA